MNTQSRFPAAFINAIAEGGTKEEAIEYLQKVWDELCECKRQLAKAQETVKLAAEVMAAHARYKELI